jgi:hypothetical protein
MDDHRSRTRTRRAAWAAESMALDTTPQAYAAPSFAQMLALVFCGGMVGTIGAATKYWVRFVSSLPTDRGSEAID